MGDCYLLLGPELGEKQDEIDSIRKRCPGAETTTFYAGDTPVADMISALQNGALFAEKRLFFVKNADLIKKKDETDAFAGYISKPEPDTTLILISDETTISKVIEKPIPAGNKKIFWELFEERKTAWVEAFFRRQNRDITPDVAETILELVENNTESLRQECSRLLLFFDKNEKITGETVEKLLAHTREESAFSLFSRIAAGDLAKSLESLRTLLGAKESPPAILAGLAWCFRKLRDYVLLCESGTPNDFEMRKIGLAAPKARKDYESAGRRYTFAGVNQCLALTAQYDIETRAAGGALEEILMDRYVCVLIRAGSK
ncbi:DNA polymerase III subunit delta [Spirochaetia bacterium]|nr:DNA polymerase III subunit delta [Spirochaetia bacterium]GHU30083.1 DNA polymerase III subunit delta [Spirochaetia bacterium]